MAMRMNSWWMGSNPEEKSVWVEKVCEAADNYGGSTGYNRIKFHTPAEVMETKKLRERHKSVLLRYFRRMGISVPY